ncbi:MAG: BLUF domain-containing protein [Janthinobacterium lividum]
MTQLYRVLYCSRNCLVDATPEAYKTEISQILARSRANNARDGVTGGLLFSDGCFAQVLEGPIHAVEEAFERIQCDERHRDVTVLQSGSIQARDFPDWSMAFTGIQEANPLADGALHGAFSGQSSAGDQLLGILKNVVVHENHWLAPA